MMFYLSKFMHEIASDLDNFDEQDDLLKQYLYIDSISDILDNFCMEFIQRPDEFEFDMGILRDVKG